MRIFLSVVFLGNLLKKTVKAEVIVYNEIDSNGERNYDFIHYFTSCTRTNILEQNYNSEDVSKIQLSWIFLRVKWDQKHFLSFNFLYFPESLIPYTSP